MRTGTDLAQGSAGGRARAGHPTQASWLWSQSSPRGAWEVCLQNPTFWALCSPGRFSAHRAPSHKHALSPLLPGDSAVVCTCFVVNVTSLFTCLRWHQVENCPGCRDKVLQWLRHDWWFDLLLQWGCDWQSASKCRTGSYCGCGRK